MKKSFKLILSLLLAAMLVSLLPGAALAADSVVTFRNGSMVVFAPGSGYAGSDLFDGFKDLMPGDTVTKTVTVRNNVTGHSAVRVYLRALPHNASNPLSAAVLSELENDPRRGSTPELAYMNDFLSQLSMTVHCGPNLIYSASPDQTDGLASAVYLGTLPSGGALTLDVVLSVPLALDNSYADRVGELDWVFVAEARDDTTVTVHKRWSDNGKNRPSSVNATLYNGQKAVATVELGSWNNWSHTWDGLSEDGNWTVRETDVPKGYNVSYRVKGELTTITNSRGLIQTGQLNWPIPVLGGLGLLLIAYGVLTLVRKRRNEKT